ncbi:MAG TPA: hypothetical protein VEP89_01195 [Draconibacterium sp.]|nr:hypothetical protein [Draconibacterium sp.]
MNSKENYILTEGKCLVYGVWCKYKFKLYLWQDKYYEVRTAYLPDEMDLTGDATITRARDIAVARLLKENPEKHIKPPHIKEWEDEGNIEFLCCFLTRKSEAQMLIKDEWA